MWILLVQFVKSVEHSALGSCILVDESISLDVNPLFWSELDDGTGKEGGWAHDNAGTPLRSLEWHGSEDGAEVVGANELDHEDQDEIYYPNQEKPDINKCISSVKNILADTLKKSQKQRFNGIYCDILKTTHKRQRSMDPNKDKKLLENSND